MHQFTQLLLQSLAIFTSALHAGGLSAACQATRLGPHNCSPMGDPGLLYPSTQEMEEAIICGLGIKSGAQMFGEIFTSPSESLSRT